MSKPHFQPRYGRPFDPWNSVGRGHQRAEAAGPHGWRETRAAMLHSQFEGRPSTAITAPEPPTASVLDLLRNPGAMKTKGETPTLDHGPPTVEAEHKETAAAGATRQRGLFSGVVVYIDGSTHPLVSDHRLRRLLTQYGARMALGLSRRQVTHVIVGRPVSSDGGKGVGGGLAAGKIEKEIRRVGGCGVKYVGVDWYVAARPPLLFFFPSLADANLSTHAGY